MLFNCRILVLKCSTFLKVYWLVWIQNEFSLKIVLLMMIMLCNNFKKMDLTHNKLKWSMLMLKNSEKQHLLLLENWEWTRRIINLSFPPMLAPQGQLKWVKVVQTWLGEKAKRDFCGTLDPFEGLRILWKNCKICHFLFSCSNV